MNNNIFVLLAMIFLHIFDDYKIQAGVLAMLKQRDWWREQDTYKPLYKYDYIVALIMHSFSWAFMIMLPIALFAIGIAAHIIEFIIFATFFYQCIQLADCFLKSTFINESLDIFFCFRTFMLFFVFPSYKDRLNFEFQDEMLCINDGITTPK